jgi:hypothetical protein
MLYNDNFSYSQSGVSYQGTLYLNIDNISSPVILPNVSIYYAQDIDYSNVSTIGLVTIESMSNGIVTMQTTQSQAQILAEVSTIYILSSSESSTQVNSLVGQSTVEVFITSSTQSAESIITY